MGLDKNPMHYRTQARHLRTGELVEVIPARREQACFADLALRQMDRELRVHEFDWHYEVGDGTDRSTAEEVKEMVHHFYQEAQLNGMTVEFLGKSEIDDVEREVVRFSNMGGYPRGLFMAKLFAIRNLNRYYESYHMYRKLREAGVPMEYAVVMASTLHSQKNFRGEVAYVMRDYARTINYSLHTMADWRNFAENNHTGQVGFNWGDEAEAARGGYNFNYYNGAELALHKAGHTNSQKVNEFFRSTNIQASNLTWKGVMEIAASLTRKGIFADKEEPNMEKVKAQGLDPKRLP